MRPSNRSTAALVIAIRFKVTVIFTFASTPNSRTLWPRRTVASLGCCFNVYQQDVSVAHDMSGLINTRYVRFLRSGQGRRCMPGDRHELLPDGRPGADDEDPRSDLASFSEEDYLVASSGDHRDH